MSKNGLSEVFDYAKYYDLERYLFEEVSVRFSRQSKLSTFDFFCIVIWKANRSKSRIAKRLLAGGAGDLDAAVRRLVASLIEAKDSRSRLRVLVQDWKFRLPMASAILTVLYPEEFTVYDVRVCQVLKDFENAQHKGFDSMWGRYSAYVEQVRRTGPDDWSLRKRDRWIWGKSFATQLRQDLKSRFQ